MLEGDENEFNTSEVAPIRASRAVSTHTSTRGVITPPKKRGGRLPVVLSITAAVLAIGVDRPPHRRLRSECVLIILTLQNPSIRNLQESHL